MSDVATAPAAPAASPSTPAPGKAASPAPVADVKPTGRAPDGRFLPKEGTQGIAPAEPAPESRQPGETKEAYRLRTKLKVYGKEEEVDLGEEDLVRELQVSRARAKKLAELEAKWKEREELERLAEKDPDEYLRRKGHNPDELAKRRLLAAIEAESMSPEQRELAAERQKREALEKHIQDEETKRTEALRELKKQQFREQRKAIYREALAKFELPDQHETIYLMGETERLMRDEGMEVTPEALVKETQRRIDTFTRNFLAKLDAPGLIKALGQEKMRELLRHSVSEFERTHSVSPPPPQQPAAPSQEEKPRYLTQLEVEANLKKLYGGRR